MDLGEEVAAAGTLVPTVLARNGLSIFVLGSDEAARIVRRDRAHVMRVCRFSARSEGVAVDVGAATAGIDALTEVDHEVWLASEPVVSAAEDGVTLTRAGDLAFLRTVVDERDLAARARHPLEAASFEAYRRMFSVARRQRVGMLLRLWNYVPGIVELIRDEHIPAVDRERYRQFNAGRHRAFETLQDRGLVAPDPPAATGVGAMPGPLIVEGLASIVPGTAVENPRQVPAYSYPRRFGTSAPAFSRAMVRDREDALEVYVSGTASIVGSETVHPGDVIAQVDETMRNIRALTSAENIGVHVDLGHFQYLRVYVKRREDFELVARAVRHHVPATVPICWLRQNICRPDLLCEIEGVASVPKPQHEESA